MIVPNFQRCTTAATKLLVKQNVKDRFLDVRTLIYDKRIIFDTLQNYALTTNTPLENFYSKEKAILKDGCTLIYGDIYIILYNAEVTYLEHLNWTLAHEIGHIYLGHIHDGDREEIEAHFFAAQLLMPEYTLRETETKYGELKTRDLELIFGVSTEAAEKRLITMRKKNSVNAGKADKAIWNIQKERIELYFRYIDDTRKYINAVSSLIQPSNSDQQIQLDHNTTNKVYCYNCHSEILDINFTFCHICGSKETFQKGESDMKYTEYEINENGRLKRCIRCDNEELFGDYCHICGAPVVNKCTDYLWSEEYNSCSNDSFLPANARYCSHCGSKSLFFHKNILVDWKTEKEEIEEEERINAAFMSIPDWVDDEKPFN